jgi:MFS family permease
LYRTAAVFLQTDRPLPELSDQELAAEAERNYSWNFAVNLVDGAGFLFGLSLISSSTVLPLFVSKLSDSALPLALVAIIAQASWHLPQLLTAPLVERLPRRKPIVINVGFFVERLPVLLMIAAAWLASRFAAQALVLFLICYAWFGLGGGMIAPAWQDLVARCFPVDRRGRFWGVTSFVGTGMGTAGAALSTWLLAAYPFPTNFVYLFSIAGVAFLFSWASLALAREPVRSTVVSNPPSGAFLSDIAGIVRRDRNFRRFLLARATLALGRLGTGFLTVSAIHRWQVPDSTVGLYTVAMLVGQTLGSLGVGFLADRQGHKLSLEFAALASVLAFGAAWLAPTPEWVYVTFFLLGLNVGATIVSGTLVSLEFCTPNRRPTYVGLSNSVTGLAAIVAPLLGAWLASVGYGWLFALTAAVNLVAFTVMRWWVREPRWATTLAA